MSVLTATHSACTTPQARQSRWSLTQRLGARCGNQGASRGEGLVLRASSNEPGAPKTPKLARQPQRSFDPKSAEDAVRLRSEAEAPYRSLRVFFFGAAVASAGIANLTSFTQLAAALGEASNALPLEEVLTNIGINTTVMAACGYFIRQDWLAREKQMARLTREEKLGALPVELANGKVLCLADLRGSARAVIVAGTPSQVAAALEAALPFQKDLQKRGVFVLPLPIFEDARSTSSADAFTTTVTSALSAPTAADIRWRATPLRQQQWREWFQTQLSLSSKTPDKGLFVGLRLDGRVRSSGMGTPPWQRYALELAPLEGDDAWQGFFSGFDGRV